jgi:1-acyl-sn-glycerol-3-phosphate acyltransferase
MFGFCTRRFWKPAFPGINFRVLTATAAFRIPVIREMWLWSWCIDASKRVAVRALSRGTSLLLYPGGEKEQLLTQRGRHRVYLASRKGFVKLALQHGCSIVPIYVFGETDLYHHFDLGLRTRQWVVSRFGAAIVLISGSLGLLPLTAVSGPPIAVPSPIAEPTQSQIDELHERYVRALLELFDGHKAKYGYADARLEIE